MLGHQERRHEWIVQPLAVVSLRLYIAVGQTHSLGRLRDLPGGEVQQRVHYRADHQADVVPRPPESSVLGSTQRGDARMEPADGMLGRSVELDAAFGDRGALRSAIARAIMWGSITGGLAVCHDWWFKRQAEEAEASRRMWDEFERTRPLSGQEATQDEPKVTLEKREATEVAADD